MSVTKQTPVTCGCPRYPKVRKFINHSLACLVARRGGVSVDKYYGTATTSGRTS